jgi:hypothetical protein
MIGISDSQNVAGILYQSMLESASRSDERPTLLTGKADGPQCAFHASIWARCAAPDRVTIAQSIFRRVVIQRVRVHPHRFCSNSGRLHGVRDRFVGSDVIAVGWLKVGDDANSDRSHLSKLSPIYQKFERFISVIKSKGRLN